MKHHIRAGASAFLVFVPFVVREAGVSAPWKWGLTGLCAFVAYVVTQWDLKPDKRIARVRKVNLDEKLDQLFRQAIEVVQANQRMPFRVNLMVRQLKWCVVPILSPVYAYNSKSTDTDYGLWFWKWTGQCWQCYKSGRVMLWLKANPQTKPRMTRHQTQATSHVQGIISLPVRIKGSDGEPSAVVRAVLNIDALTLSAAQELAAAWESINATGEHKFLALSDTASLYC